MNKRESNKVNSFNASIEVMLKGEPIWRGSANITKQFGLIRGKMSLIHVYDQKKIEGPAPSTVIKKDIKVNVIPMAVKLSKSAVAYAAGIKDLSLEYSVRFLKSDLTSLKELSLLSKLQKFYAIIAPIKDKLENLNPNDIADFALMLDHLKEALPQPQVELDESKTATYNLETLILEINAMFKELDKFIDPYEYTNPDFYHDYKNSRGVKDLKGKSSKKKNQVTKE